MDTTSNRSADQVRAAALRRQLGQAAAVRPDALTGPALRVQSWINSALSASVEVVPLGGTRQSGRRAAGILGGPRRRAAQGWCPQGKTVRRVETTDLSAINIAIKAYLRGEEE